MNYVDHIIIDCKNYYFSFLAIMYLMASILLAYSKCVHKIFIHFTRLAFGQVFFCKKKK